MHSSIIHLFYTHLNPKLVSKKKTSKKMQRKRRKTAKYCVNTKQLVFTEIKKVPLTCFECPCLLLTEKMRIYTFRVQDRRTPFNCC